MLSFFRVAAFAFLTGALPLATLVGPAAAESRAPVVVELYTSQGCSSCPPADALLAQLAQRDDVIALSLHVDYWDYIGWEDPFALGSLTERQRAYARHLDRRTVYTPQMVVDGIYDVIGSRARSVANAIEMARERATEVEVALSQDGVRIGSGTPPAEGAAVWLLLYDSWHETDVRRGENAGRQLGYAHVVRDYRRLGDWRGEETELPFSLAAARAAGRSGAAVIVQAEGPSRVLGAASLRLE
ncbi:DUF1223 domain-containing protein [Algihabitans albus]|uniref:DUF1223 domain-containing protein n=1 Tax=Algihabitans albus TaxID=2164067 RepID=UPI0035D0DECF